MSNSVASRGRGLTSWIPFEKAHPLDVGESVTLDGVVIEAVNSVHRPIAIPLLGFTLKAHPGPYERMGLGSTGFRITVGDKTVVNLGDSLFLREWAGMKPDVLMLPIGGRGGDVWTMYVVEALEAVKVIQPGMVIPCHCNVRLLWMKSIARADEELFRHETEEMGVECRIMGYGDTISFPGGISEER